MKRLAVGPLLLQLLQPLPAIVPFCLAELQQLALTLLLLFRGSRRTLALDWGDSGYLLTFLAFDAALGVYRQPTATGRGKQEHYHMRTLCIVVIVAARIGLSLHMRSPLHICLRMRCLLRDCLIFLPDLLT